MVARLHRFRMADVDEFCPICGSDDRQVHNHPLAWECTDCGTVY